MKFLVPYKNHIKVLLFLVIAFGFLYISGVHIIHDSTQNILDWRIQIGETITFPVFLILKSILIILIGFWLATKTITFCEKSIKHFKQINPTSQSILINIIQIFIYFIFFVSILDLLHFQHSSITVISGAAAFGLSLGLRQIASNLVSGFILLLEHSINVGDFVEMKDQSAGFVRRIGTLYTHIEITDGREIFIPNGEIFNYLAANWTLNHKYARITFEIIIDYTTDINLVKEICLKAINAHPAKSKNRPAEFLVDRFGEFGLIIKLRLWLDDILIGRFQVQSDILSSICEEFKKAKIAIPTIATANKKQAKLQKQFKQTIKPTNLIDEPVE